MNKKIIETLSAVITPDRWATMQRVVAQRTRNITIVLEEICQENNMSAALRSAEGFGLQEIHIIEGGSRFSAHQGIAKGAAQWIDIKRHRTTSDIQGTAQAFAVLRERGYTIVATTPHPRGKFLRELPVNKKIALVFGTEETGVSDYVMKHADAFVTIPMYGFTESFNISVSVATCLYDLTTRLRQLEATEWQLTQEEREVVLASWLMTTVRGAQELLERVAV